MQIPKYNVTYFVAVAAMIVFFVAAPLPAPMPKDVPPSEGGHDFTAKAPAEIAAIFRRSCYDCHSDKTVWPWYSRLPLVSALITKDVIEARKKLNFSTWNENTPDKKRKLLKQCIRELELGDMPLPIYLSLHPGTKISSTERDILLRWLALEAENVVTAPR